MLLGRYGLSEQLCIQQQGRGFYRRSLGCQNGMCFIGVGIRYFFPMPLEDFSMLRHTRCAHASGHPCQSPKPDMQESTGMSSVKPLAQQPKGHLQPTIPSVQVTQGQRICTARHKDVCRVMVEHIITQRKIGFHKGHIHLCGHHDPLRRAGSIGGDHQIIITHGM